MKRFGQLLFCVLVIAFTTRLAAQDNAETNYFRVLGYGDGLFQGIFFEREGLEGEKEMVELAFTPDRKSRPYQIPTDSSRVVFYREEDAGQNSKRRIEVGRVSWAASASAATLVFLEQSDFSETKEFGILFIDESPESWGAGDFRFLNLAGADMDIRLGDETFALEQGLSQIYTVSGKTRVPFRLSLFVDWEGERRMVYSMRTIPDAKHGKMFVLKPPTELGSLRVRVIPLW